MTRQGEGQTKTALVTGASSGIGRELAILCAQGGHDLLLVARSQDRLEALAKDVGARFGVSARGIALDLTEAGSPQELFEQLQSTDIDVLINNAGFGYVGRFADANSATQLEMVQLNVLALTHLTHLWLPSMIGRGKGRILNVASTAGFVPGPFMAVYYASKAYVLSLSEALSEELAGTGVTVTALCPGPTLTGFQARANAQGQRLIRLGAMDARWVAEQGYLGMMRGRTIVVPGLSNRLVPQLVRFGPRFVVRKVVAWLNSAGAGTTGRPAPE